MRVLVTEEHGDFATTVTDSRGTPETQSPPARQTTDPTAPDLSLLGEAITALKQGNPQPLRAALGNFIRTFDQVVMENPSNRMEIADVARLKELATQAREGNLPPDDPELLTLGANARRNGKAAGAVYKFFLTFDPYGMFAQLRSLGLKAFQPVFGPVLAIDGDTVRDVLSRHREFTVDPYGREMRKTMTSCCNGADGGPGLDTFILGTDDTPAYEPDKELLTRVVRARDVSRIRPLLLGDCRRRIAAAVEAARRAGELRMDLVTTLARFVPVTLGKVYLGVPAGDAIERFELNDEMLRYYGEDLLGGPDGTQVLAGTGLGRDEGMVADEATMYHWIKTAFECFFNNVQKDPGVQREGFRSCRLLLCCLLREIERTRSLMKDGARLARLGSQPRRGQVRNTMLSRLVELQLDGEVPEKLITDLRIAENVMGTMVGAVAGQEEATCRVLDALLKLGEGVYKDSQTKRDRGSLDDARKQALVALDSASKWRSRRSARNKLFHYFRECLRLEPQGEVLLRQCAVDGTRLFADAQHTSDARLEAFAGNRPLRAGDLVFAAHGAAMKDVAAPDEFRLRRQPADDVYLFYGYGRHKCLGQYISPVLIVETMIAVLALEGLSRAGDFVLDDKNLYAKELWVEFSDTGSTKKYYASGQ